MAKNEYGKAFRIIWDVISISIMLGIIFLLFIPQTIFLKLLPICEWQKTTHQACFFCGMGRALTSIAHGQLNIAVKFNLFSIPFSLLLVWNEMLWLLSIKKRRPLQTP